MIIAIDGFSSTGKSTLAKQIAKTLNYRHIDSGAMYRAVALFALRNNLFVEGKIQEDKLINHLGAIEIDFKLDPESNQVKTYLNGEDVESQIRELTVSKKVSQVAKIPVVREFLVEKQRKIGEQGNIVMDGRDIGTVVFPNAEFKFFITADADIRAKRRYDELLRAGKKITFEEVMENINNRDMVDSSREHSPLKQAEDAIVIDNSYLNKQATIDKVLLLLKDKSQ